MEPEYGFAFNNPIFADRLLRIKITGSGSGILDVTGDRKRKREDFNNGLDLAACSVESDLSKNQCEEETQLGHENEKLTNSSLTVRVKELHISSAILAAKSPFFLKLFSNGMLESEQKNVALEIDASEEDAVVDLLKFMYTNTISATTAPAVLDVLMIADKYEVALCMSYCSRLLLDMPMTVGFQLRLLNLPASMLTSDSVKTLRNAAKQFITSHYKDLKKFPVEELMALPLVGMEAILASTELQVFNEDMLYDTVLKWAKENYSDLEERQQILGSRLARLIRFPQMSFHKLVKIVRSGEFSHAHALKYVLGAIEFKSESMHCQRRLAPQQHLGRYANHPWVVERAFKQKPIQSVEFELPRHKCIVYLDLTRGECEELYSSGALYSQFFKVRDKRFSLYFVCKMDQTNSFRRFGLFLMMIPETEPMSLTLDYKFSARMKPTEEFVGTPGGYHKFTECEDSRNKNLFSIPSESFMANDSPYFINDFLHLQIELSIRQ